ncbi:MAG TPA: LysR family transcriptional regulator [Pseudolabrys sp.]|nr:LysR family transcriptional regulator [Pseudolabrys sp.]
MSLRALRTLIAIAEQGSFAGAARTLNLSQSAISMQMRGLEAELKAALFDRSKRPPSLNEAGRAVVGRARDLVAAYEEIETGLKSQAAVEGRIRLGAVGSTLTGLMPMVLTVIRRRHANLHIEIVSGFSEDLLRQVSNRSLDAAIVSDYDQSLRDILWRPFLRERLVVIAPPDAPDLPLKRLAQRYPFVRYSPNAPAGRMIDRAIKAAGLDLRETMQLDWLEAIEAMVHHGHGISIVPERRFDPGYDVKRLSFGPYYRTLGIIEPTVSRKRRLTDILFDEFVAVVRRGSAGGAKVAARGGRKPTKG